MCWIVFVNVAHIGDTWEGGISIETASILLAHELVWEGIFLIAKLMEKGPVHCSGTFLTQVVLDYLRRTDECKSESEAVNSVLPWYLLEFLPLGPCLQFPAWVSLD